MKVFADVFRKWSAVVVAVLLAIGVLSDVGGALTAWSTLVEQVQQRFGVHYITADNNIASFVLFILAISLLLTLLYRAANQTDKPKEQHDSAAQPARPNSAEERARSYYLALLERDVSNRLKASIHNASIHNDQFIPIGSEELKQATVPWHFEAYDDAARTFKTIDDAFNAFDRRILLLGDPGSGKTTTLLYLAKTLIQEAKNPDAPIPLLVNLSKFRLNPTSRSRRPALLKWFQPPPAQPEEDRTIENWLIELTYELPFEGRSREIIRSWVENGRVALLLDGLDEVDDAQVLPLVERLNKTYFFRHPNLPVVVCSRTIDYRPLQDKKETQLRLNGAVVLQPLTDDQIDDFLERAQATALRDAFLGDEELYKMARTPLTLSMMTLAYGGLTQSNIPPNLSSTDRRRDLFDTYVKRMMQRTAHRKAGIPYDQNSERSLPTEYSAEQVNRYLSWLARRLSERRQTVFPLARLHSFLDADWKNVTNRNFLNVANMTYFVLIGLASLLISLVLNRAMPPASGALWLVADSVAAMSLYLSLYWVNADQTELSQQSLLGAIIENGLALIFTAALLFLPVACITLVSLVLSDLSAQRLHPLVFFMFIVIALSLSVSILRFENFSDKIMIICTLLASVMTFVLMIVLQVQLPLFWMIFILLLPMLLARLLSFVLGKVPDMFQFMVGLLLSLAIFALLVGMGALMLLVIGRPEPALVAILLSLTMAAVLAFDHRAGAVLGIPVGAISGSLIAGLPGAILGATVLGCAGALLIPNQTQRLAERLVVNPLLLTLLALRGYAPLNYRAFLAYAIETLLLKQVGTEYEFVHRLLREHFVVREITFKRAESSVEAHIQDIRTLSLQGEAAFGALATYAKNSEPRIRQAAIAGLGRVATPPVLPLLKAAQSDDDPIVRRTVIEDVSRLTQSDAYRLLQTALGDPDLRVQLAAIDSIDKLDVDDAARLLYPLLGRADPSVLQQIVQACVRNPDLVPRLRFGITFQILDHASAMLDDPDPQVRRIAIALLSHIDTPVIAQRMIGMLSDGDPMVRLFAAAAVGQIGGLAAVPKLLQMLREEKGLSRRDTFLFIAFSFVGSTHAEVDVRPAVAEALGAIGAVTALPALLRGLQDYNPQMRLACIKALGQLREPATEPELLGCLSDRDVGVQVVVCEALGLFGSDAAVAPLLTCLCDGTGEVRAAAATALGLIENAAAVPDLLAALQPSTHRLLHSLVGAVAKLRGGELPDWYVTWRQGASRVRAVAAQALGQIGDSSAVSGLLRALEDADANVRVAAVAALEQLGDTASLPGLIQALHDLEAVVRRQAVSAVGRIDTVAAVPHLFAMLDDTNYLVSNAAKEQLDTLLPNLAVPQLVSELQHQAEDVRTLIVEDLGRRGGTEAIAALLVACHDAAEDVRAAALEALDKLDAPQARELFHEAARDESWQVRLAAVQALGRHGAAEIETLLAASSDAHEDVRRAALEALGAVDAAQAREALHEAARDEDNGVRVAAVKALGRQPDEAAYSALLAACHDDDENVRIAALEALGAVDAAQARETLREAARDESWQVRLAAVQALAQHGMAAIDTLLVASDDDDEDVRVAALEALDKLDTIQADEVLRKATRDDHRQVRLAAVQALGRRGADALPTLLAASHDTDEDVRAAALEALGQLDTPQARAEVVVATRDAHIKVRVVASKALGRRGDVQAIAALLAAIHDAEEDVRVAALAALDQLEAVDDEAIQLLRHTLRAGNLDARSAAARALRRAGLSAAVPDLLEALGGDTIRVRCEVAQTLGVINDQRAVTALRSALADIGRSQRGAKRVCDYAAESLEQLGASEAIREASVSR